MDTPLQKNDPSISDGQSRIGARVARQFAFDKYMPIDSLTAVITDSGFTNVVVTSKTCDKIRFSAT